MSEPFFRRVEVVTDFLDSIGDLDFDSVRQHLADDAVMVLPFVDNMPALQGKSAIVDQLSSSIPQMFERMNFAYDQWYDVRDDDALIVEYHSECPQKGSGATYDEQLYQRLSVRERQDQSLQGIPEPLEGD